MMASLFCNNHQTSLTMALHDSNMGSIGGQWADTSPNGNRFAHSTGVCPSTRSFSSTLPCATDMTFSYDAVYFGEETLDRRHTPAMISWVMADVRRVGEQSGIRHVRLVVGPTTLSAFEGMVDDEVTVFEHRLQTLTRFTRTPHEPRCFSYLTRSNLQLPFTCHVFLAADESTVRNLVVNFEICSSCQIMFSQIKLFCS